MPSFSSILRRQKFEQGELVRAYKSRYRPGWPTTFDAAMQSRYHALCVEMEARRHREALKRQSAGANTPKPCATVFNMQNSRPANGQLDGKRLAAGERADD